MGIKDTNDHIVSVTLHVLADLVPMLGAATVIGGNRGKLFTDGRPKVRLLFCSAKVPCIRKAQSLFYLFLMPEA